MTEIIASKNDERCFISVIGHNKDKKVCAMISALVATLEGYLINNCKDDYFYYEGDGESRFTIPIQESKAVEMFLIGIMRLEKTFPDKVKTDINNFQ